MTNPYTLPLLNDANALKAIPDSRLIRRFTIQSHGKARQVNDPVPELKTVLQSWNPVLTAYYENQLIQNDVSRVAQAYLPGKSIMTNALTHRQSAIAKFDFTHFYDSCRFAYFYEHLKALDPAVNKTNVALISRLLIDPNTGGVTQGLPVSGALAGLSLIPFWVELKKRLPASIRFTQYSDDLTLSFVGRTPPEFTIPVLTQRIYEALKAVNLEFELNKKKTRIQSRQFRKVTGIRINHYNQTTPARKSYRFLRHALHILSKSDSLEKELTAWGFESKAAFVGTISYMRSIDSTGKIDRLIMKNVATCRKHNLFGTWIDRMYAQNAFA